MIPDKALSIAEGAIAGNGMAVLYGSSTALPMRSWMHCAEEYDFDLDTPL